jgi:hypothetical protein
MCTEGNKGCEDGGEEVIAILSTIEGSEAARGVSSAVFVIAYLMKHWKMSALEATRAVKAKWDACWPCDRFTFQLVEYEKELRAPVIQACAQGGERAGFRLPRTGSGMGGHDGGGQEQCSREEKWGGRQDQACICVCVRAWSVVQGGSRTCGLTRVWDGTVWGGHHGCSASGRRGRWRHFRLILYGM